MKKKRNELTVEDFKKDIKMNLQETAFIVGNGINRLDNKGASWEDILSRVSKNKVNIEELKKGLSLTEIYEIIKQGYPFQSLKRQSIKDEFLNQIKNVNNNFDTHAKIIKKMQEINRPLMTTNIDNFLDIKMRLNWMPPITEKNYYYPWNAYFSQEDKVLQNPLEGFAVWHINGLEQFHRSIQLGLLGYMNMVNHAKKYISDKQGIFEVNDINYWNGKTTWLRLIFSCNLCIFGLGLSKDEIFLRWLLLERNAYFRSKSEEKKRGWYLTPENDIDQGERLFLNSVGFQIVPFNSNDYRKIYDTIVDL